MRVLVTRPKEDGEEIAALLAAMGHQALLAPLLSTHFLDVPAPDLDNVQAILATSANGVRAFARLSPAPGMCRCSRSGRKPPKPQGRRGFILVRNADGDARAHWRRRQHNGRRRTRGTLLHVSGEESGGVLGESLAALGFVLRRAVLYRVDAADDLPAQAATALRQGAVDAALFFSPRSARVFASLVARDDLPVGSVIAVCISPVTAAALMGGEVPSFAGIRTASRPNQTALLACLSA